MTASALARYGANPAEAYANTFVPTIAEPVLPPLLECAALRPGERVLDVACGTGVVARASAARVGPTGHVAGLDITEAMVAVARQTPQTSGVTIDWRQGDAGALPYDDGSFDAVLCQMGVMFFSDRLGALTEMRRVLAPGGRVVIGTPGPIPPLFTSLDAALVEHVNADLGGFVRTIFSLDTVDALTGLMRAAGFEDVNGSTYRTLLQFPEPRDFLWQYIASTPLGEPVAAAPDRAQDALEAAVVESWQPAVKDGLLPCDLTMILASARPADHGARH